MDQKRHPISVLGAATGASFASLWTVIETLAYFGLEPLKNAGALGVIWLTLGSLYLGLLITAYYYKEKFGPEREPLKSEGETPKGNIADAILNGLKALVQSGDYHTIIRFGSTMSRPLWLQGEYRIRI